MVIPMAHAQTNNEQALSLVTSSSFEMIILPTLEELDAGATSKLKAAMKSKLFSEALSSTALSSVFDMDIGLQQIDWTTSQDSIELKSLGSASTELQFIVLATLFKNDNGDFPSLYALDSHIVQTFSQPSSKSSFLSMLVSSNEPLLSQVTDIQIGLIDSSPPTSAPAPPHDEQETGSKSLSSLDIILIVASTAIFLGIVYMIYQHHKDRADMEERQARSWNNRDPRTFPTPRRRGGRRLVEQENRVSASVLKCNIEVYGGDELFDEEAQAPSTPSTTNSPKEDPDPGSPPLFRKLKFTTDNIEAMPSPPVSPFSTMPSASSHGTQGTGSPHRLGAPKSMYTTENASLSPSSAPSPLSPRLSNLPNMAPDDVDNFFKVSYPRSVKSAPVFSRVQSSDSSARAQIGETHPSSMISSSSESSSSSASVRFGGSASGKSTKSVASADVSSTGTDTAEFDDNWFKAKAAELEEEEDDQDSLEEVFQADAENNVFRDIDDNQSKVSGQSVVTEWVKSIPVVQSQTSESTNSTAAEHSSDEPKSAEISEHGSVDNSLERSLATSCVEV
jgi:hypothetical protein